MLLLVLQEIEETKQDEGERAENSDDIPVNHDLIEPMADPVLPWDITTVIPNAIDDIEKMREFVLKLYSQILHICETNEDNSTKKTCAWCLIFKKLQEFITMVGLQAVYQSVFGKLNESGQVLFMNKMALDLLDLIVPEHSKSLSNHQTEQHENQQQLSTIIRAKLHHIMGVCVDKKVKMSALSPSNMSWAVEHIKYLFLKQLCKAEATIMKESDDPASLQYILENQGSSHGLRYITDDFAAFKYKLYNKT